MNSTYSLYIGLRLEHTCLSVNYSVPCDGCLLRILSGGSDFCCCGRFLLRVLMTGWISGEFSALCRFFNFSIDFSQDFCWQIFVEISVQSIRFNCYLVMTFRQQIHFLLTTTSTVFIFQTIICKWVNGSKYLELFANVLARYCLSFLNFILFQSLMKIATLRWRGSLGQY